MPSYKIQNNLCLFHFHQVIHFRDHTKDLRRCFFFYRTVHLRKTKRLHSSFLPLGSVDNAFNLCYFNFFHFNVFI